MPEEDSTEAYGATSPMSEVVSVSGELAERVLQDVLGDEAFA